MGRGAQDNRAMHVNVLIINTMSEFMKHGTHPLVVVFHIANHPYIT